MPCTYQIQNTGTRICYIFFVLSLLDKSLRSLLGRRLTGQGKGKQQPIKFFAKFYNDTRRVVWILDFLLPVSLNGPLMAGFLIVN